MSLELKRSDLSEAGIAATSRLLRQVFAGASHLDERYLQWCYNENPAGPAVGFDAYDGDTLAAHYITQPCVCRVDGVDERAVLSLNTATHPDYRGQGLFPKLAAATYAAAREEGYGHVVGVANANSTPGFIRKLGFQLVAGLDVKLGLGPVPAQTTGSEVEARYARSWTDELLKWRLARPGAQYSVTRNALDQRVYAHTGRYGLHVQLASLQEPASILELGEPTGLNPLRLWIGLDHSLDWGSRYVDVPKRLRPSPLNLIFLDLGGRQRQLEPGRSKLELIDFDAY